MIRFAAVNLKKYNFISIVERIIRKAIKALLSIKPANLLSEDIRYKIYFYRSFMPDLYQKHIASSHTNCLFCSNLIKSEYHGYCLICSKGTYDNCCLPLPDILHEDSVSSDNGEILSKPWYFMKTCSSFVRLPKKQYLKNLRFMFSSITIHNYETLEGLENGILSGSRPCYVCASVDYEMYKRCKRQSDYDIYSPCLNIKRELEYTYESHSAYIRPAG